MTLNEHIFIHNYMPDTLSFIIVLHYIRQNMRVLQVHMLLLATSLTELRIFSKYLLKNETTNIEYQAREEYL